MTACLPKDHVAIRTRAHHKRSSVDAADAGADSHHGRCIPVDLALKALAALRLPNAQGTIHAARDCPLGWQRPFTFTLGRQRPFNPTAAAASASAAAADVCKSDVSQGWEREGLDCHVGGGCARVGARAAPNSRGEEVAPLKRVEWQQLTH